jgi:hypothetical protein
MIRCSDLLECATITTSESGMVLGGVLGFNDRADGGSSCE